MSDKQPLVLGALPECGVIDCPEMASPRGGRQGIVVTMTGSERRLRMQAHIFTCAKHSQEFARMADAGVTIAS